MICGDLDLDRAERDLSYLRLMRRFLVWGEHRPYRSFGFPDLRPVGTKVARLAAPGPRGDSALQTETA